MYQTGSSRDASGSKPVPRFVLIPPPSKGPHQPSPVVRNVAPPVLHVFTRSLAHKAHGACFRTGEDPLLQGQIQLSICSFRCDVSLTHSASTRPSVQASAPRATVGLTQTQKLHQPGKSPLFCHRHALPQTTTSLNISATKWSCLFSDFT